MYWLKFYVTQNNVFSNRPMINLNVEHLLLNLMFVETTNFYYQKVKVNKRTKCTKYKEAKIVKYFKSFTNYYEYRTLHLIV